MITPSSQVMELVQTHFDLLTNQERLSEEGSVKDRPESVQSGGGNHMSKDTAAGKWEQPEV